MSLLRRRGMMYKAGELPAGYKRCEYLQGLGDSRTYIVIPELNITYDTLFSITVMYPKYTKDTNACGSLTGNVRFEQGIGWNGRNYQLNYIKGAQITSRAATQEVKITFTAYMTSNSKHKYPVITMNGVQVSYATYNNSSATGTVRDVYLFGTNRGNVKRYFSGRIYGFYLEGQINLIPALDRNDTPCMYDTVSKKTFYNAGTGKFLYELA